MEHWQAFTEFVTYELAAGGPDPHMRCVEWMSRGLPRQEQIWRAGVYVSVYNVPSAEVIWRAWPWARVVEEHEKLAPWIAEHWGGLSLRRERRAVRTPIKLARCLLSYARWAVDAPDWIDHLDRSPDGFQQAWSLSMEIDGFGRYAQLKLIETLRRMGVLPVVWSDIRAYGGWSPRMTLALLDARLRGEDPHKDGMRETWRAEQVAGSVLERFRGETGLPLDWFRFEVFLCDYRQSIEGRRQYPGRSNDSEIEYHAKIYGAWPNHETLLWSARQALLPAWARGEIHGWAGPRKELGVVLADYGYTWSDLLYRYPPHDLARPERRDDLTEAAHDLARAALDPGTHERPAVERQEAPGD